MHINLYLNANVWLLLKENKLKQFYELKEEVAIPFHGYLLLYSVLHYYSVSQYYHIFQAFISQYQEEEKFIKKVSISKISTITGLS